VCRLHSAVSLRQHGFLVLFTVLLCNFLSRKIEIELSFILKIDLHSSICNSSISSQQICSKYNKIRLRALQHFTTLGHSADWTVVTE